tara:strand:- start:6587 stop:7222 length:636 start_codon:yes stop_codon:yes gene_type:complete
MELGKVLIDIGYALLAINTILYFVNCRNKTIAYKAIVLYLIVTSVVQFYSHSLSIKGDYNLFLTHYYFIGQFLAVSVFFYKTLTNKTIKKIICFVPLTVIIALSIQYFKNPEIYYTFNLFEILITSVPILIYCFSFIVQQISNPEKKFIYFVSGLFSYILCSTLIFLAGNITGGVQVVLWKVNNSLYIVFQLLIFLEWYKNFRKKRLINLT